MKIRTLFTILSLAFVVNAAISNIPAHNTPNYRCVSANVIRSHGENGAWITDFKDEYGHEWREILDDRPDMRGYTLLINDNGTPYDYDDDVVERIM